MESAFVGEVGVWVSEVAEEGWMGRVMGLRLSRLCEGYVWGLCVEGMCQVGIGCVAEDVWKMGLLAPEVSNSLAR